MDAASLLSGSIAATSAVAAQFASQTDDELPAIFSAAAGAGFGFNQARSIAIADLDNESKCHGWQAPARERSCSDYAA